MTTDRIPYRYDIVGSFLRKPALKAARKAFEEGKITKAKLTAQEDASIRELVEDEKRAGLKAVTDGEYRRAFWHLDFLWNLTGIDKVKAEHFSVAFRGFQPKAETIKITGKIDFLDNHPGLDHFRLLKSIAGDTTAK